MLLWLVLQPHDHKDHGLGSSRFARRYLGNLSLIAKSFLLISFPLPTKMCQFGRYRFSTLCIQIEMVGDYSHRVAPFGDLRVYALSSSPKLFAGYASFIAC